MREGDSDGKERKGNKWIRGQLPQAGRRRDASDPSAAAGGLEKAGLHAGRPASRPAHTAPAREPHHGTRAQSPPSEIPIRWSETGPEIHIYFKGTSSAARVVNPGIKRIPLPRGAAAPFPSSPDPPVAGATQQQEAECVRRCPGPVTSRQSGFPGNPSGSAHLEVGHPTSRLLAHLTLTAPHPPTQSQKTAFLLGLRHCGEESRAHRSPLASSFGPGPWELPSSPAALAWGTPHI